MYTITQVAWLGPERLVFLLRGALGVMKLIDLDIFTWVIAWGGRLTHVIGFENGSRNFETWILTCHTYLQCFFSQKTGKKWETLQKLTCCARSEQTGSNKCVQKSENSRDDSDGHGNDFYKVPIKKIFWTFFPFLAPLIKTSDERLPLSQNKKI